MGRYDILTNLENKPKATSPAPTGENNNAKTSLLANQQSSKPVRQQISLPANSQASKEVNQQTSKLPNQQNSTLPLTTKEKRKYGTYLREDSILDIRVHAAQTRKKDHEYLQEIVDSHFRNLKS
jgi:hypothetical protein